MSKTRGDERHGLRHTVEYKTWDSMIQRCTNPNCESYKNYGARGIKVCVRWRSSFQNFIDDMGKKPFKHYSIDRIDSEGDYEASNCRWASWEQQNRNRQFKKNLFPNGVSFSIQARKYKVSIQSEGHQIHLGYFVELEAAITARQKAEADHGYI